MSFNIKEIIESWAIASSPTSEQKLLAEARYSVCLACEHFREKRKITGEPFCKECGCPVNKKIFSPRNNPCPLSKWENVDNLLHASTQKNKKSFL
jgi:hypothetical protein